LAPSGLADNYRLPVVLLDFGLLLLLALVCALSLPFFQFEWSTSSSPIGKATREQSEEETRKDKLEVET